MYLNLGVDIKTQNQKNRKKQTEKLPCLTNQWGGFYVYKNRMIGAVFGLIQKIEQKKTPLPTFIYNVIYIRGLVFNFKDFSVQYYLEKR